MRIGAGMYKEGMARIGESAREVGASTEELGDSAWVGKTYSRNL